MKIISNDKQQIDAKELYIEFGQKKLQFVFNDKNNSIGLWSSYKDEKSSIDNMLLLNITPRCGNCFELKLNKVTSDSQQLKLKNTMDSLRKI